MSCRDGAPGRRGPALLLVLLGAAGAPVGAQVDDTQGLDFQAQARLDLNYREPHKEAPATPLLAAAGYREERSS